MVWPRWSAACSCCSPPRSRLHHLVVAATQGELSEDPHDLIATRLLHTANGLTGDAVLFGAIYLLLHGVVKVVLVVALLQNRLWAYPWMIGVLLAFIGYQIYRISLHPTVGLVGLTIFDIPHRRLDLARVPAAATDRSVTALDGGDRRSRHLVALARGRRIRGGQPRR